MHTEPSIKGAVSAFKEHLTPHAIKVPCVFPSIIRISPEIIKQFGISIAPLKATYIAYNHKRESLLDIGKDYFGTEHNHKHCLFIQIRAREMLEF